MIFKNLYTGSDGNLSACYSEDEILIIDPGVPISKIRKEIDITKVVGVLITHSHLDHCEGMPKLLERGRKGYATPNTIKAIGDHFNFYPQQPNEQFIVGKTFKVKSFSVKHDADGAVGFYISDGIDHLLFVTDTPYIQPNFKDLTIIAIEANYSEETIDKNINKSLHGRIINNHMSIEQACVLLKANDLSKVREVHLLHMSKKNSDAVKFKGMIREVVGAGIEIF